MDEMKEYIYVDPDTKRIGGYSSNGYLNDGTDEVQLDTLTNYEEFDPNSFDQYRVDNNTLIYDPITEDNSEEEAAEAEDASMNSRVTALETSNEQLLEAVLEMSQTVYA